MTQYLARMWTQSGMPVGRSKGPYATVEQARAAARKLLTAKYRKPTDQVVVETLAGVQVEEVK